MRATRRHLGISLALIVVTTFSATVVIGQGARGAAGDWSAINSVPSGDKLSFKLRNGQTVEGKFASSSNEAVSLSVNGKSMDVKRDEVLSVRHLVRKSVTQATLIGLAVGAGGGA